MCTYANACGNHTTLCLGEGKVECFHYGICEELFAGFTGHFLRVFLTGRFYVQRYVLAYAHVLHMGKAQIVQGVAYCFALRIQQLFVRHYVDVCYILHVKSKFKIQKAR